MPFAELCITSNFTFLTGASHPEEYAREATVLGLRAFAIADRNSVAGIVRAHQALKELAREGVAQVRRSDNIGHAEVVARGDAAFHGPGPRRPAADPPERTDRRPLPPEAGPSSARAAPLEAGSPAAAPPPGAGRDARSPDPGEAATKGVACAAAPPASVRADPAGTHPAPPARSRRDVPRHDPRDDSAAVRAARSAALRAADPDGPTKPEPLRLAPVEAPILPRLIPAVLLALEDGQELVALPQDRAAWGRLTRLLTLGKRRAPKGRCHLTEADVIAHAEGLTLLWRPPEAGRPSRGARAPALERWARRLPGQVFLLAAPRADGQDGPRLDALAAMAAQAGVEMVASAAPLMHDGRRRAMADVLSCIRLKTTIDRLGRRAQPHAERRLRSEAEMRALFARHPGAVDLAAEIADTCRFSLDELRYEYPDEVAAGENPQTRLERLTAEGLRRRYPEGVPARQVAQASHELELIRRLNYAPYFLTVRDLVAFAESQGILCQGRGSAANSLVCYALGVTAIGPHIAAMVFERFVSEARDEPPDIDVDFEHERREEVIQHIYTRYGRHRAGLCATVIHYRARRAIREVGKAMGLSADVVSALASQVWGWSSDAVREERIREVGLDPTEPRLARTLALVAEIIGFPRHLSQHVGGFIITKGRLDELVPIENAAMEDRTLIEWDKDDIDALGILKVDVLSLGMLTCIRKAFDLIEAHGGDRFTLATLPPEDPGVYDMLCEGDSIGVFQVESRAQMSFLPRMKPREFYDLVIEVAIVRPGPIQGDMVHPYLRRRRGEEAVVYPSDALGDVLRKTLGVPLFQEQAMQIAIIGAGFTPEEADRLRRALATFRKSGTIGNFRERFIEGMVGNGHDRDFAERCFSQIEGFGEYGFPESHAASFALLVYASAWLKRRHAAAFACGLLNSQPMGFYAPAQIVRDAREHGVEVRPICVNDSFWDNTLERSPISEGRLALRLGFRQIKAMKAEEAERLVAARGNGWRTVEDLRRAGLAAPALTALAEADAFASLGLSRREALWEAKALGGRPLPLFARLLEGEGIAEPDPMLPEMTQGEEVVEDYVSTRLTLREHPLALLRPRLTPERGAVRGGVEPPLTARPPAGPAARGVRGASIPGPEHPAGRPRAAPRAGEAAPPPASAPVSGPDRAPGLRAEPPGLPPPAGPLREGRRPPASAPADLSGGVPAPRPPAPFPGDWPRPPGCIPAAWLDRPWQKARICVAGLVIVRQRPGTAGGVIFITLEDETGVANIVVWTRIYETYRRAVMAGPPAARHRPGAARRHRHPRGGRDHRGPLAPARRAGAGARHARDPRPHGRGEAPRLRLPRAGRASPEGAGQAHLPLPRLPLTPPRLLQGLKVALPRLPCRASKPEELPGEGVFQQHRGRCACAFRSAAGGSRPPSLQRPRPRRPPQGLSVALAVRSGRGAPPMGGAPIPAYCAAIARPASGRASLATRSSMISVDPSAKEAACIPARCREKTLPADSPKAPWACSSSGMWRFASPTPTILVCAAMSWVSSPAECAASAWRTSARAAARSASACASRQRQP